MKTIYPFLYNLGMSRLPYILYLMLLVGCSGGSRQSNFATTTQDETKPTIFHVSLEKAMDSEQQVNLSEIGNSIAYIPLETSSKSLMSQIRQVIICDSLIYLHDGNRALQFSLSGRFIRQFGRTGRGPGEYIRITDCCISADGKQFNILTTLHQWIKYQCTGEYISSCKLDSLEPTQILAMNQAKMLFHCYNAPKYASPLEYSLFITDLDGNVLKTFRNYHKRVNNPGISIGFGPFYWFQNHIQFKEFGVDTMYTMTTDTLVPHAVFSLGKYALPADLHILDFDIKKTLANYVGKVAFTKMAEDMHSFYMTFDYLLGRDSVKYGYYNKHTGNVKVMDKPGFTNNLDGGTSFFPKYVYNDSILVDYIEAYALRKQVLGSDATEMKKQYGKKFEHIEKLAKSLHDESNPILVIVSNH